MKTNFILKIILTTILGLTILVVSKAQIPGAVENTNAAHLNLHSTSVCTSSASIGIASEGQLYAITTANTCNGYGFIEVYVVGDHVSAPTTLYCYYGTSYMVSTSSNYVTVTGAPDGLKIYTAPGGNILWVGNNYASLEDNQIFIQTGATQSYGGNIWYQIYVTDNVTYPKSGTAQTTAWVDGQYLIPSNAQYGSVNVTISPSGAISAGAEWNLDNQTWQSSGTTLSNVLTGSHTIYFNSIGGWTSPSSQSITVTNGNTYYATGTYTQNPQYGSVNVTISPSGAISAGAEWNLDNQGWQSSGTTLNNVLTGSHTIYFNSIGGWTSPSSQSITVTNGNTYDATGTYTQNPQYGSVNVTISPSGAISAGAEWNLDNQGWQSSGTTLNNVSVGGHTIYFNSIGGWSSPSSQSITVTNGYTYDATGTYTQNPQYGSVNVTISPSGAISAGAEWNLDNQGWQSSGTTLNNVSVGGHTIYFNSIGGWTSPSYQSITVTNDNTYNATGTYTQNSQNIYITPTSLTLSQPQKRESALSNIAISNTYGVTSNDVSLDKNYQGLGLAARVIVPRAYTNTWRNLMAEKYGNARTTINSVVDWSTDDSPVKNQGSCGSCWAFSAVALIENLFNQGSFPSTDNFSEQEMVSCVPNNNCSGGWYFNAFDYITEKGLVPELCFPYASANEQCGKECLNPTEIVNISQFTQPLWSNATVSDLKMALQQGPICVAMNVYNDFYTDYHSGIYDYNQTSTYVGMHAILLVGYDDNNSCFKAKNSWGTGPYTPGQDGTGYFRISYNDVTNAVAFGSYASYAEGIYIVDSSAVATTGTFTIKDVGSSNLSINSITSNKSWLTVSPSTSTNLAPGSSILVTVSLADWNSISKAIDTATITINSNDPIESNALVTVIVIKSTGAAIPQFLISTSFYQDNELPDTNSTVSINVGTIGKDTVHWSAHTNDNWLTFSDTSGINNGVIPVNYASNNTGVTRIGHVTLTSNNVSNSPQVVSITQGTNHAPFINDVTITTNNLTDTVHFTNTSFINQFFDEDGNTLKTIRIITFPDSGTLELNNYAVVAYQAIEENDIHNLVFIPSNGWSGNSTFEYNSSDGDNYAITNANVIISKVTGIERFELSNNISIHPNPNNGIFTVEVKSNNSSLNLSVKVFDAFGRVVYRPESIMKGSFQVDLSKEAKGVYFIQINDGVKVYSQKLVIE